MARSLPELIFFISMGLSALFRGLEEGFVLQLLQQAEDDARQTGQFPQVAGDLFPGAAVFGGVDQSLSLLVEEAVRFLQLVEQRHALELLPQAVVPDAELAAVVILFGRDAL